MRLYGKRSITERLKSNPRSIKKVYIQEHLSRPDIAQLARQHHVPVENLSEKRFHQLAQGAHHQGVMAETDKFPYTDLDEILSSDNKPVLLFLDRINDPQNLGSIIRTSACFGGFCVVIPIRESVEVTEAVLKVACGGENFTPICQVTNLAVAVQKAKEEGYWIGATVVEEGESPRNISLNFPLGLIFGSEGGGIRPGLIKHIDYKLTLPMTANLSFNVAMAVSVFCYETVCQRNISPVKKTQTKI